MSQPSLQGRTYWLAAILIAAGFAVVKLDVLGAGTFVNSHGRWAAGIGLAIFAMIVAISLHSYSDKRDGGPVDSD
jgi:hypothetical protein